MPKALIFWRTGSSIALLRTQIVLQSVKIDLEEYAAVCAANNAMTAEWHAGHHDNIKIDVAKWRRYHL